jgi:hypothetical protein
MPVTVEDGDVQASDVDAGTESRLRQLDPDGSSADEEGQPHRRAAGDAHGSADSRGQFNKSVEKSQRLCYFE